MIEPAPPTAHLQRGLSNRHIQLIALGIGIIGAGHVGPILGAALAGAGHAIIGISAISQDSRDRAEAILPAVPILPIPEIVERSELVILAVPDDQLDSLISGLAAAGTWQQGQLVLHTSARYGTAVLQPAFASGIIQLAIHPAMTFTGTSIDIARLSDSYFAVTAPTPVLDGVDLRIEPGQVVAILGASGSGKSTLIRCINGLEKLDMGSISVDGFNVADARQLQQARRCSATVFQLFNLYPHLTALQNITLAPMEVLGQTRAQAQAEALRLLESVGLGDRAQAFPAQLSGGQRQRVGICRALAMKPRYLLLDEVTSALDPEMTSEVLDILVGHVTKEGALAGPRVLEHIVDTVLYFEGDAHSSFRLVRAIKNRFGAVNELGVFAMTEKGLKGVSNPSALFLSQHDNQVPGSCVMVTQEGTRPLLVEIQALVDTSHLPNARRLSVGLEQNRLAMLLAVAHRHAGIAAFDQDVFINAVGGVKITEPAADLAVLLAINSSMRNKPLPRGLVVFGEVGLAGEIRPAPRGQERLREAAKLGFTLAVVPKSNLPKQAIDGIKVIGVERIDEAFNKLRDHE